MGGDRYYGHRDGRTLSQPRANGVLEHDILGVPLSLELILPNFTNLGVVYKLLNNNYRENEKGEKQK